MATVTHPAVVQIHGIESWRGRPFLVVEFLAGGTLKDRLRHGPLPAPQAVAVAALLSDALAALHDAGYLHGDVKPSNVGSRPAGRRSCSTSVWLARPTTPPRGAVRWPISRPRCCPAARPTRPTTSGRCAWCCMKRCRASIRSRGATSKKWRTAFGAGVSLPAPALRRARTRRRACSRSRRRCWRRPGRRAQPPRTRSGERWPRFSTERTRCVASSGAPDACGRGAVVPQDRQRRGIGRRRLDLLVPAPRLLPAKHPPRGWRSSSVRRSELDPGQRGSGYNDSSDSPYRAMSLRSFVCVLGPALWDVGRACCRNCRRPAAGRFPTAAPSAAYRPLRFCSR